MNCFRCFGIFIVVVLFIVLHGSSAEPLRGRVRSTSTTTTTTPDSSSDQSFVSSTLPSRSVHRPVKRLRKPNRTTPIPSPSVSADDETSKSESDSRNNSPRPQPQPKNHLNRKELIEKLCSRKYGASTSTTTTTTTNAPISDIKGVSTFTKTDDDDDAGPKPKVDAARSDSDDAFTSQRLSRRLSRVRNPRRVTRSPPLQPTTSDLMTLGSLCTDFDQLSSEELAKRLKGRSRAHRRHRS